MNKIFLLTMSTVLVLLFSESVLAAPSATPSVESRVQNQQARIEKGRSKGQLTTQEEKTLKQEHTRIKSLLRNLTKKQGLSKKDEKRMHKELNKASLHIFKKRYNGKVEKKEPPKH